MKYEKGQRVRLTRAMPTLGLELGCLGSVCEWDSRDSTALVWFDGDGNSRTHWVGVQTLPHDAVEPADAPAVGAPVPEEELRNGFGQTAAGAMPRAVERAQGEYANARYQQQDRSQMMGLGGWEPADVTKLKAENEQLRGERVHWTKELDAYAAHVDKLNAENVRIAETLRQQNKQIGSLEAALKEATGSKLRVGDLHGTVAVLRSRVAELEGNEAWLRREVVRLGGKNRGAR